jgi:hypothetical protein
VKLVNEARPALLVDEGQARLDTPLTSGYVALESSDTSSNPRWDRLRSARLDLDERRQALARPCSAHALDRELDLHPGRR